MTTAPPRAPNRGPREHARNMNRFPNHIQGPHQPHRPTNNRQENVPASPRQNHAKPKEQAEICRKVRNAPPDTPPEMRHASQRQHLATQLEQLTLPKHTQMLLMNNAASRIVLQWENVKAHHCVTLTVDLSDYTASYEYSTVCEADDRLRPFPARPLNSTLVERINMNLNHRAVWTWLQSRLKATNRFSN